MLYLKALEYLIRQGGYTQRELARRIGDTAPNFNSFLKGTRNYSESKKEKLAQVLGTTYLDMLNLGKQLLGTSQPPLKPQSDPPGEPCAKVIDMTDLPHEKIIERFSDKCTAREINLMLVELERNEPELFVQARTYILALYDVLKVSYPILKDLGFLLRGEQLGVLKDTEAYILSTGLRYRHSSGTKFFNIDGGVNVPIMLGVAISTSPKTVFKFQFGINSTTNIASFT